MKSNFLRIVAVVLAAMAVISSFSVSAFAYKTKTLKNINDDVEYIIYDDNLIDIHKASLYTDGKYICKVYVIGLMGSDFSTDKTHPNCVQNCFKSGFSAKNSYLEELKQMAVKKIPKNASVILIGHSLGGMIAQQFSADKEMKERYNILNVVCMGSPYVVVKDREGVLRRMGDSGDAVPYLSPVLLGNAFLGNYQYENSGYFGNPGEAHLESYRTAEKWARYDCLGVKDGTSVLKVYI